MKTSSRLIALAVALVSISLPACSKSHAEEKEHAHQEHYKLVLTSPMTKDVTVIQPYVCQIRAQQYIEVRSLQEGYLKTPLVGEGQTVRKGDVLFEVLPILFQRKLETERAEARYAQIKYDTTKQLHEQATPVVSAREVALAQSELDKINAKVKSAEAELNFTTMRAEFDGIIDRQLQQTGALVDKKDVLTTLSDISVMRVYFNVPEANYLTDRAGPALEAKQFELVLANGRPFPQRCQSITIEGEFDNKTGTIPYRADFPNPKSLLRHGQTGNVLMKRSLHGAVLIPQRATFEFLDKRYVFVVGDDRVVRQRLIDVQDEQDDIFIINKDSLSVNDKIILDGIKQVSDGKKIDDFEFRKPEEVMRNQKFPAE